MQQPGDLRPNQTSRHSFVLFKAHVFQIVLTSSFIVLLLHN